MGWWRSQLNTPSVNLKYGWLIKIILEMTEFKIYANERFRAFTFEVLKRQVIVD